MRTRNKRNKRKTRKIRGGGIVFDGVWKSEPGVSGDRLTYSNAEAGFLNIVHPAPMHNILAFFDDIDEVIERFLALYTGIGESQEEMRASGYDTMLRAIQLLNTAVEYRTKMDKDFEGIDSITVTNDKGIQVQRPITLDEKARHRHRTEVLNKLLKALRQVKKPIDEIFESFVSKPEKIVKKIFTIASLENEEGFEDDGPYVPSAPPRRPIKNESPTEEEIEEYMEACRSEKPSCDYCGKTDVPLFACSGCKQVKYCSKECQKNHWRIHKPDCKPSVTESYKVCSFPFHLEKVHTVHVQGNVFVVSTDKEIVSFTTKDNRCLGPLHSIKHTPQDMDYIMRVNTFLSDMDKKNKILERGLQAYDKQYSKNPESKTTQDAHRICNELKRRIAGIETQMTELLVSHQVREPIDWKKSKRSLIESSLENQKEIERTTDVDTLSKLEKRNMDLKYEISTIQKIIDISFPVHGLVMVEKNMIVSTKNSIYFVNDRTRIGEEAEFIDGPKEKVRFDNPTDMVWVTPNLLCIVDTGNNAIRIMDDSSKIVGTFFERGEYNDKPYTLNHPMGVAGMPESGVIVVADTGNHCITIIDIKRIDGKNDTKLTVIGEPGKPGWRDGSSCLFNRPESVCVHNDSIIVADTGNHCIRRLFLKDGIYHSETIAGTPRESGYKNGKKALFSSPCKVKRMGDLILVADRDNDKVRLVGTTLPCIKGLIL